MLRRLKNELVHSVWAMWHQMKMGDFHQFYTEKRFSGRGEEGLEALRIPLSGGNEITLHGVIDRVDVSSTKEGELVKIVDYKSSDYVELSLSEVYHGLQMQLVTYMAAAKELLQRERPKGRLFPPPCCITQLKRKIWNGKKRRKNSMRSGCWRVCRVKDM